jgi:major membrane immunogen (membrane-anchored lipoprotein)
MRYLLGLALLSTAGCGSAPEATAKTADGQIANRAEAPQPPVAGTPAQNEQVFIIPAEREWLTDWKFDDGEWYVYKNAAGWVSEAGGSSKTSIKLDPDKFAHGGVLWLSLRTNQANSRTDPHANIKLSFMVSGADFPPYPAKDRRLIITTTGEVVYETSDIFEFISDDGCSLTATIPLRDFLPLLDHRDMRLSFGEFHIAGSEFDLDNALQDFASHLPDGKVRGTNITLKRDQEDVKLVFAEKKQREESRLEQKRQEGLQKIADEKAEAALPEQQRHAREQQRQARKQQRQARKQLSMAKRLLEEGRKHKIAKMFLERIVKNYPGTEEAKEAAELLQTEPLKQ